MRCSSSFEDQAWSWCLLLSPCASCDLGPCTDVFDQSNKSWNGLFFMYSWFYQLGFYGRITNINYSIQQTFLFTSLGLKSGSFAFFLCPSCHHPFLCCIAIHKVFHLSQGLYQLETWIQLDPCHHTSIPWLNLSKFSAALVMYFCACKLPFEYHRLRVHRFVPQPPQHFYSIIDDWFVDLLSCMYVDSRNWYKRVVAFRAALALWKARHAG